MKKLLMHNGLSRTWQVLALFLIVNCQLSIVNSASAQEAFYIYRNDGDFDGFFFDEVKRMGCSKFDLDSVEHAEYVVQEIETADTIYRIPLVAIDSISFVQPEIKFNSRLKFMSELGEFRYYYYSNDGMTLHYTVPSRYTVPEADIPSVGDVLVGVGNCGPEDFVGKVRKVDIYKEDYSTKIDIECDSISDFNEVFEQLISVERLATDDKGQNYSRMAGWDDAVQRRIGGNREFSILSINQPLTVDFEPREKVKVSLGVNLNLDIKGKAVYNVSMSRLYCKLVLTEDFEAAFNITADVELESSTKVPLLDGVSVKFPTMIPLFEVRPVPGAFLKTEGHLAASLTSPKFARGMAQTIIVDTSKPLLQMISGSFRNMDRPLPDGENGWTLTAEINGSVQTGVWQPIGFYTNSWARKIIEMGVGMSAFIGPKLSAAFTVDAENTAKGDLYGAIGSSKISLTPVCIAHKTEAELAVIDPFNWDEMYEKQFTVMEGEVGFWTLDLKLFPTFQQTLELESGISDNPFEIGSGTATVTIYPRGMSPTYRLGVGAYDKDGRLAAKAYYNEDTYAFYNTWDEATINIREIPHGKWNLCPIIDAFGLVVPVLDAGTEVNINQGHFIYNNDYDGNTGWNTGEETGMFFNGGSGRSSGTLELLDVNPLEVITCTSSNPAVSLTIGEMVDNPDMKFPDDSIDYIPKSVRIGVSIDREGMESGASGMCKATVKGEMDGVVRTLDIEIWY